MSTVTLERRNHVTAHTKCLSDQTDTLTDENAQPHRKINNRKSHGECPENARKMLRNRPERKYSPLHYGDIVTNGSATSERHVTNDVRTNLQSNGQIN